METIYDLNLQNVADQLKRLVFRTPPSEARQRAVKSIQHFEARQWQPGAFIDSLQRAGPGEFAQDDQGRLVYRRATDSPDELHDAVGRLVVEYSIMVMPDENPQPVKLLTTREAAAYVGISEAGIRKHVYQYKDLIAEKIGHDLRFRPSDLDELKARELRPGRPAEVK